MRGYNCNFVRGRMKERKKDRVNFQKVRACISYLGTEDATPIRDPVPWFRVPAVPPPTRRLPKVSGPVLRKPQTSQTVNHEIIRKGYVSDATYYFH